MPPHILISNDDGVQAPGLLALVQALRKLARVTVLAPNRNWSASGHVKTLHKPLEVRRVSLADGTPAMACNGSPADCVALAVMGVVEDPLDLVVSGINPSPNLSTDMIYSGTVSVAVEAVINGLPGIAISSAAPADSRVKRDYSTAAETARQVVEKALAGGLTPDLLLNVNVPHLPESDIAGWQVTRQGIRVYKDKLLINKNPRGEPYYWIGGEVPSGVEEEGTDIGALNRGYVSIMPLSIDLTDYDKHSRFKQDGWETNRRNSENE